MNGCVNERMIMRAKRNRHYPTPLASRACSWSVTVFSERVYANLCEMLYLKSFIRDRDERSYILLRIETA